MQILPPPQRFRSGPALVRLALWAVLSAGPSTEAGRAAGLESREPIGPYLDGRFPASPPAPSGDWTTTVAFPRLTFEDPLFLVAVPRGDLLYVGGRQGEVWSFANDPNASTKSVFLDLRARCQGWDDGGLLAMAFHPRFGQPDSPDRGHVYIWYNYTEHPTPGPGRPPTDRPTHDRLARFTVPDGSTVADPNSELVLIDQYDRNIWHNGGGMFFHPGDGFLYLSLGDEGGDYGNTQRIDKNLFSGVLRIDVDCRGGSVSHPPRRMPETGTTAHYFIPDDNPWVGVPDALEEFWCIGFRSPHRMTFDAPSGRIWLGDVGDAAREEIDLVERAGNYQWRYKEGTIAGPGSRPVKILGTERPPVHDYPHDQGSAVIGGYVYRGAEHSASLGGKYVFGDNGGRIWALTYDGGRARVETLCDLPHARSRAYGVGLSSFGVDRAGELYLCQLGDKGQIYRLARKGTSAGALPRLLSETGAFRDVRALTPRPGLVPYDVNAPLWSDGAAKSRWIAVPTDGPPYESTERIGFAPTGEWSFPDGTVFVKHFEIATDESRPEARRRLETRFLVRSAGGGVYGVTYRWRGDGSDAELVGDEGRDEPIEIRTARGTRRQTWHDPGRRECLMCHTPASGHVLGVKTRQLNPEILGEWARLGLLDPAPLNSDLAGLPRLVAVTDARASVEDRARSYLDANCAHCHRPGGVRASFDARYETPARAGNVIEGPVANALDVAEARVVASGAPERSILYRRLTSPHATVRMPPLATSVVDADAEAVFRAWIAGLPAPPAPPKIRLKLAPPGAIAKAGSEITLEAEVEPGAGAVGQVEFLRGGSPIGAAAGRPFVFRWTGTAVGSYALAARTRDDRGSTATSDTVLITVVEPPKPGEDERDGIPVSGLDPVDSSSGYGPVEKDRSNGERSPGDGRTLTLNGKSYDRGLGVHARSELRYRLASKYTAFLADVGVDDEVGDAGSVVFQVWADGTKLYESGVLTGRSATRPVRVDVSGRDLLKLVVTDSGDGDGSDHADWAAARLLPVPAPGRPRGR